MTSKQDYERLAKIIRRQLSEVDRVHPDAVDAMLEGVLLKVACDIATWCGETNSRFDRTRFLQACGITDPQGQRVGG